MSSRACLTPARPRIALALANPADRRLLAAFLREGDVEVLLPEGPIRADALRGASLVIVDEAMARRARTTLLGLRREAGPLYLPLLVAVRPGLRDRRGCARGSTTCCACHSPRMSCPPGWRYS